MQEPVVRAVGAMLSVSYAALIVWLAVSQPQSIAEVTGGLSATVGVYRVDPIAFEDGLRFFHQDQFVAARAAFSRADSASRDARTQFYIAYSYYREGWGRMSHDDTSYAEGLKALDRAIAVAPGGRIAVDDPRLQMHTADELRAELLAGQTRDWSDLNPMRVFPEPQVTPVREALVLPLTFLTVVLSGGVHLTSPVAIEPPTLFSLVLASLVLGVLVQTGTLDPVRLMHGGRSQLANVNGLVVLVTLFLATAQVLSMMTPASGLPSLALNLFFLIAILQLLAANVDRVRFLRVWAVTLLSSFTIKFILLTALSGPADRPLARALQVLVEGLTLGAFSQPVEPASSGYLAFATLALYLFGLALLPGMQRAALVRRH